MIAPDHDRRLHDASPHEIVDRQAEPRPLAIAKPENPRGKTLERDALGRQPNPAAERLVCREHLQREPVGRGNVGGIA